MIQIVRRLNLLTGWILALLSVPLLGEAVNGVTVQDPGTGAWVKDGQAQASILLSIEKGTYLYQESLEVTCDPGLATLHRVEWPPAHTKTDPALGETVEVQEGSIIGRCELSVTPRQGSQDIEIPFKVRFQTCQDTMCFPPQEVEVVALLRPYDKLPNPRIEPQPPPSSAPPEPPASSQGFDLSQTLAQRGLALSLLIVFALGVAASFTPCVFPLVPVVVTMIGAGKGVTWRRGLGLSCVFVLGLATTYTVLGLVAALTKGMFGALLLLWPVKTAFACLFFGLALALFGAYEIQVPSWIRNKVSGRKGSGVLGAYLTGMAFGVAGSACLSPILAGILALIASSGNVLVGGALLFSFALGLGTLFILVGASYGLFQTVSGAGMWTDQVKKLFGVLLVGAGIFFLRGVLTDALLKLAMGACLVILGSFLLPGTGLPAWYAHLRRGIGFLCLIVGACYVIGGVGPQAGLFGSGTSQHRNGPSSETGIQWLSDYDEAQDLALSQRKPLMLDFSSPGCLACVELEETTFRDASVIQESSRFICVKVVVSGEGKEKTLAQEFSIRGFPTLIFIASSGEERRSEGYVKPEALLQVMRSVSSPPASTQEIQPPRSPRRDIES